MWNVVGTMLLTFSFLRVSFSVIIVFAKRLSTRQLILRRILPSVCMFLCVCVCVCVCFRHASGMQSTCGYSAMRRNSSQPGVCMHATHVHIRPPMLQQHEQR